MKYFALVNPGLASVCAEELKGRGIKPQIFGRVLEFESSDEQVLKQLQSPRRILRYLTVFTDKVKIADPEALHQLALMKGKSFRVEVENLKGQDNRIEMAKQVSSAVLDNVSMKVEFKKPDVLLVAYQEEGKFYLGIDVYGEMHRRSYRVFPHSASFTGDYAFFLVQTVGLKKGEKFLSGYGKDGSISIEAAHYIQEEVFYFDPSVQNVNAARKNAQIAGVGGLVRISKGPIDDVDIMYDKDFFDRMIMHLTTKDEGSINELYSQSLYVLKKKGRMLLVTRDTFELSVSDKFKLISVQDLVRGESVHKLWLLEKK